MDYRGYCGYPPPLPPQRERRLKTIALAYVGLVVLTAVAVATYVLLQRLDRDALTVIAAVGCAGGIAMPGTILALAVLLRQRASAQATTLPMTPPQVVVIPPMQFSTPPTLPSHIPTLETVQPRHFTIVGGDE